MTKTKKKDNFLKENIAVVEKLIANADIEEELGDIFPEVVRAQCVKKSVEAVKSPEKYETLPAEIVEPDESNVDQKLDDDFELARKTIRKMIESGSNAAEVLQQLLQSSYAPRYFEVFSDLMGQISNSTKDLLELHEKVKKGSKSQQPKNVTNNNLYVTTNELLDIIKNNKNGK